MIVKVDLLNLCKAKRKSIEYSEDNPKGLTNEGILARIDEVEQAIKNYCMIATVPDALKYTWVNMTVDLCAYESEVNYRPADPTDGVDVSDLSSIKVGDTSVFYGDKYRSNLRSRTLQAHENDLDAIVMNYASQLNRFRRLW